MKKNVKPVFLSFSNLKTLLFPNFLFGRKFIGQTTLLVSFQIIYRYWFKIGILATKMTFACILKIFLISKFNYNLTPKPTKLFARSPEYSFFKKLKPQLQSNPRIAPNFVSHK